MRGAVTLSRGLNQLQSAVRSSARVSGCHATGSPVLLTACISGKVNSSSVPDNPLHTSLSGSTVSSPELKLQSLLCFVTLIVVGDDLLTYRIFVLILLLEITTLFGNVNEYAYT